MRKFMLGLLFGIALAITSTTYADEIKSMVGKNVQGEFPVYINGLELDTSAVVIDGTSFLPVRKISEYTNYDIGFDENKKVITLSNETNEIAISYKRQTTESLNEALKRFDKNIRSREATITDMQYRIDHENFSEEKKQEFIQSIVKQQEFIDTMKTNRDILIAEIVSRKP